MRAAGEFRMIFRAGRFTVPYAHAEGVPVTEGDQETLRALYDECVLSADAKVGLWLDQMKKMDYSIGQSSLLPPTTEMNYWSMVGWDTLRQVMTAS
jgi:hypothetical protein